MVIVKWETNTDAGGFVEYGTDSSMAQLASNGEIAEEHEVELTDLQSDRTGDRNSD